MSAVISRESRASGVVVEAQNTFAMSDDINIPSDMVNILCRFKNLHLKKLCSRRSKKMVTH